MAYDPLLGLWEGTPGDPAIKDAWGTLNNTNFTLLGQAITGDNGYAGGSGGISIAGLTTYSLTVTTGASNQARQLLYPFVGALTGNCTVTIASSVKFGWAMNATTGGHDVLLKSGVGTTATLPPDGVMYFFYCDGAGNVTLPDLGFGTARAATGLTVTSGGITVTAGGITITAGGLTVTAGTAAFGDTVTVQAAAAASTSPVRADQAWQIIATYTPSGAASQAIPLSSSFKAFRLTLLGMTVDTLNAFLGLQFSSDGGVTYNATNYAVANSGLYTDGTAYGPGFGKTLTNIPLTPQLNATSTGWNAEFIIYPGGTALRSALFGQGQGLASGSQYARIEFSGAWDSTPGAMNYCKIIPSPSGTFSGTIIIEGLP